MTLPCPHCERAFPDPNALWQHARAKHSRAEAKALRPARGPSEPSLAAEHVAALEKQAAGEPLDEYEILLPEMLP